MGYFICFIGFFNLPYVQYVMTYSCTQCYTIRYGLFSLSLSLSFLTGCF